MRNQEGKVKRMTGIKNLSSFFLKYFFAIRYLIRSLRFINTTTIFKDHSLSFSSDCLSFKLTIGSYLSIEDAKDYFYFFYLISIIVPEINLCPFFKSME